MGCFCTKQKKNVDSDSSNSDSVNAALEAIRNRIRRRQTSPSASPSFPDANVRQILELLPVKSLIRFRCVSKSWGSFISNPNFVNNHLHFSTMHPNSTNHRLLLLNTEYQSTQTLTSDVRSCSVKSLFRNPHETLAVDACYRWENEYQIAGSCNGLMCLIGGRGFEFFRLWNPSTRVISNKGEVLGGFYGPKMDPYHFTLFGFGYDRLRDRYKVVAIFCVEANAKKNDSEKGKTKVKDANVKKGKIKNDWQKTKGKDGNIKKNDAEKKTMVKDVNVKKKDSEKTAVKIYTFGDHSWRKLRNFPHAPVMRQNSGVFASHTLNWLATRKKTEVGNEAASNSDELVIVSIDIGDERYREILLPDLEGECYGVLGVLRDCLCFSYYDTKVGYVVWLMKEYGVRESWAQIYTISYQHHVAVSINEFRYSRPLLMTESGELLLQTEFGRLMTYKPIGNIFRYPQIRSDKRWSEPLFYVESLASPMFTIRSRR